MITNLKIESFSNLYPLDNCCPDHLVNESLDLNEYEQEYQAYYESVFNDDDSADIPARLHLVYAQKLQKAFLSGFKERLAAIDYNSPDMLKRAMYEANIYEFSGFKNWKLSLLLNDLAKDAKSFEDFKAEALKLYKFNANHLKTEYNFAEAASQMSAQWLRYQETSDQFDLRYSTAGDSRVRSDHKALDGITAPANDPIWNRIYPPNGWGCRCDVIQVPRAFDPMTKARNKQKTRNAGSVEIEKEFAVNRGKTSHIFELSDPLYKDYRKLVSADLGVNKASVADMWGIENWHDKDWSSLPEMPKFSVNEFESWLNQNNGDHFSISDYKNLRFGVDPKYWLKKLKRAKYSDTLDVRHSIRVSAEILKEPDEVWLQTHVKKAKYKATYLKNYKDKLIAVVCETEADNLLMFQFYEVERKKDPIGNVRNGILIKKRNNG